MIKKKGLVHRRSPAFGQSQQQPEMLLGSGPAAERGSYLCKIPKERGTVSFDHIICWNLCLYLSSCFFVFLLFLLKTNKIPSLFTTSKGGGKGGKGIIKWGKQIPAKEKCFPYSYVKNQIPKIPYFVLMRNKRHLNDTQFFVLFCTPFFIKKL